MLYYIIPSEAICTVFPSLFHRSEDEVRGNAALNTKEAEEDDERANFSDSAAVTLRRDNLSLR